MFNSPTQVGQHKLCYNEKVVIKKYEDDIKYTKVSP